jgi:hypothetical protein
MTTDHPVVSVQGFSGLSQPLQEMGAHGPVGLITRDGGAFYRIQNPQPRSPASGPCASAIAAAYPVRVPSVGEKRISCS